MKNIYRNSAWLYDMDNRDNLTVDIPFYIEYANQQKGEVLELGCGTGRVALSLAKEGVSVTGVDLSEQMLEVFRGKLKTQPELADRITLIHENMADFNLQRKFAMVIAPFRAFQALTDDNDIENALACVRKHLDTNGIFIINVFNPRPVMDESWCFCEAVQWEQSDELTGNYVMKWHSGDKIDVDNQVIYPRYKFEITYPDGKKEYVTDEFKMKYYYNEQLRRVIEKAGMEIFEEFSWYDKSPPGGREIIFVCKAK
ncbi:MAG: class I SAM-dependent methyltransferase [Oscillospiraceae bacterium]|nr:class I SAM-dependent methyltransferase [Oscillospiraceae bacterium]